ncbi:putative cyclin-dependent kinase F-2 [Zea mays]|uniref:[RNA-polymerase]-subunit kinase n=1 Tax=Zea mays TaxID=4577 RepID=A0A3L6EFZ2_MAIZE|nr:putative cyclin-dependent kinase F-2 [Zea mays]
MVAASNLVNGGVAALQIEGEPEEPQSQTNAAAALAPVPWLPSVAERYERREKLGQGMFSDVYKAWDRVHDHLIVVKRLSGRTDDRFVKTSIPDFVREVMSLAACRGHPSIVQLVAMHVDGNRADGDCFAVTEHTGPMNLRQYMDARRVNGDPFDEDEVRDVMRQLLAGAKHTHGAGVLHRNIVPENVIVGMDGATSKMVYKICGFSMSKPAAQTAIEVHGNLDGPKEQGDDEEGLDEGVEPGAHHGALADGDHHARFTRRSSPRPPCAWPHWPVRWRWRLARRGTRQCGARLEEQQPHGLVGVLGRPVGQWQG